jgi:hypothetical protein
MATSYSCLPANMARLVDRMSRQAQSFFQEAPAGEMWTPRLLASTPSGVMELECPNYHAELRDSIFANLRLQLRLLEAECYVLAAEAWLDTSSSELRPSLLPTRREVLLLSGADQQGNTWGASYELIRDVSTGRVTKLALNNESTDFSGPIFDLLR